MTDEPLIDPDVRDELESIPGEDPFLTEYAGGSTDENQSISLVEKWMMENDEWKTRTNISLDQAHALAALENISEAYPELEEVQPFLDQLIEDYIKYLTSVEGQSRQQHTGILQSIFGTVEDVSDSVTGTIARAFANPPDSDDD